MKRELRKNLPELLIQNAYLRGWTEEQEREDEAHWIRATEFFKKKNCRGASAHGSSK